MELNNIYTEKHAQDGMVDPKKVLFFENKILKGMRKHSYVTLERYFLPWRVLKQWRVPDEIYYMKMTAESVDRLNNALDDYTALQTTRFECFLEFKFKEFDGEGFEVYKGKKPKLPPKKTDDSSSPKPTSVTPIIDFRNRFAFLLVGDDDENDVEEHFHEDPLEIFEDAFLCLRLDK